MWCRPARRAQLQRWTGESHSQLNRHAVGLNCLPHSSVQPAASDPPPVWIPGPARHLPRPGTDANHLLSVHSAHSRLRRLPLFGVQGVCRSWDGAAEGKCGYVLRALSVHRIVLPASFDALRLNRFHCGSLLVAMASCTASGARSACGTWGRMRASRSKR